MEDIIIMPDIIKAKRQRLRTKINAAAAITATAPLLLLHTLPLHTLLLHTLAELAQRDETAARTEGADIPSASLHELFDCVLVM